MKEHVERCGLSLDFVDMDDMASYKSALKSNTKLVFFETPANTTLRVFDIAEISKIAHDFSRNIIVAVDNTMLTSFFQVRLPHVERFDDKISK